MIKKLDIDLMDVTEEDYESARREYSRDYPTLGDESWNNRYPKGFLDWAGNRTSLNARGEQQLVDKINEIIDHLNLEQFGEDGEDLGDYLRKKT